MSFGVPLSEEQGERLYNYSSGRYSVSWMNYHSLEKRATCLNPYSTGRYSVRSNYSLAVKRANKCLNPYSTGRYSVRLCCHLMKRLTFR